MTGVQTCALDRKSTRLNSSHTIISYAVFCLKKTTKHKRQVVPLLAQPARYDTTPSRPARTRRSGRLARGAGRGLSDPLLQVLFFFNDTATTEIYTLSLHDALPI